MAPPPPGSRHTAARTASAGGLGSACLWALSFVTCGSVLDPCMLQNNNTNNVCDLDKVLDV